jgi:hypothetical protein
MTSRVMHYEVWAGDGEPQIVAQSASGRRGSLEMAKQVVQNYLGYRTVQIRDSNGAIVWTPTWEAKP